MTFLILQMAFWYERDVQMRNHLECTVNSLNVDYIKEYFPQFNDLNQFLSNIVIVGAEEIPSFGDLNQIAILLKSMDTDIVSIKAEDISLTSF